MKKKYAEQLSRRIYLSVIEKSAAVTASLLFNDSTIEIGLNLFVVIDIFGKNFFSNILYIYKLRFQIQFKWINSDVKNYRLKS